MKNPTERILEMKNLGIQTGTMEASLTKRTQELEESMALMIKERNALVKEIVKSKII